MRITQWLEELRDDVTGAFRQMRASRGFTAVAVLTLALGVGANSAIFALADAAFLRPLPFATPQDRLVMIWERLPNGNLAMATPLDHRDWAGRVEAHVGQPGGRVALEQVLGRRVKRLVATVPGPTRTPRAAYPGLGASLAHRRSQGSSAFGGAARCA